ncbi:SDR family NAD(P)-dependent oxidoreductase [Aquamicrobium zhengzhouense]|uniref:SDR family NAD(P)-dependent oxidoreductase n=1 Tax=Aquamicrobium zhengzhouense TaxID=2781738 RepID=A0ABS0SCZ0_9HYPH|nr:SDR family NAD(P)-dependent oxidoreductase [Aquamicrobium zhengzhouense]MBI1620288.1 SDR family NAD(P)-dependent oxidoreductase [Aquamicrobium zhengzhouense]
MSAKGEVRPICLVTGAARRLGAAIVRHLAGTFDVAIHFNHSEAEAKAVACELEHKGARVGLFQADLADADSAAGLVRNVYEQMGPISLLVNSASSFRYDSPSEFDAGEMRDLLSVNLVAPMVIAREFAKVASEKAVLINMLDNKVFAPNPDFFSYSLAKFALKGATDMLAMHFRNRLRVAGIAPGVTLISGDQTEENFRKSWQHSLTGTGATPEEIASTVEFIWKTTSINGEIIVLDGGQHLMSLERDVAFVVKE